MQLGVTITAVSASPNPVIRLSLIRPITARQSRHNNHHFGNHKQLSVRPHTDHCPLLVVDIHLIHVHQDIHLPLYGCPKCCGQLQYTAVVGAMKLILILLLQWQLWHDRSRSRLGSHTECRGKPVTLFPRWLCLPPRSSHHSSILYSVPGYP